jgi:DnaJ-class molecular chaperone
MPQHDKRIPENARCSTCAGAGWKLWSAPDAPEESTWIVCRECLGSGRTDKVGRKRQKPDDPS